MGKHNLFTALQQVPSFWQPMTMVFQLLVDPSAADILQAEAQQNHYADAHRQEAYAAATGSRLFEELEEQGDPVSEAEHLPDSRGSGPDEQLLIKWTGYPIQEATWEPIQNLHGCKELLRAF
ncbi:hypothetical protein Efla_002132 [Eimeria flavescens]